MAGYALNCDINRSSASGSVTADGGSAGGLVGETYLIYIETGKFEGDVKGYKYTGGLVAGDDSSDSSIVQSYSVGTVVSTGDSPVGGLAGYFMGSVSESYSESAVESQGAGGTGSGLVGDLSGDISYSYFNGTVSGDTIYGIASLSDPNQIESSVFNQNKASGCSDEGDFGMTAFEMTDPATFEDWLPADHELCYTCTWYIPEGDSPKLLYFYDAGGPIYVNNSTFSKIGSHQKAEDATGREVYWTLNSDYVLVEDIFIEKGPVNDGSWVLEGIPVGTLYGYYPFTGSMKAENGASITVEWDYDEDLIDDIPYPGIFNLVEDAVFEDIHLILNVTGDDCGTGGLIVTSEGVEIRNSQITGTKLFASCGGIGGFISTARGRNVLENCAVNIPVFGTGSVGGFIGETECSDQTTVFMRDCHYNFTGDVSPRSSVTGCPDGCGAVGGLIGHMGKGVIENCSVNGSVFGASYVGGLVGEFCSAGSFFLVNNCSVHGSVKSVGEFSGGLVGYIDQKFVHVMNSYVTADVSGSDFVGGLIGWAGFYPLTIESSYTTGNIVSESSEEFNQEAGGLIGHFDGGHSLTYRGLLIVSSFTAGDVNVINTGSGVMQMYAGGLVGNIAHKGHIIDSYATGSVQTNRGGEIVTMVGGLVGYIESGFFINSMALNEFINGSDMPDYDGKVPVNRLVGHANNDANELWFDCDPEYCTGSCCTDISDCECGLDSEYCSECGSSCWHMAYDGNVFLVLNSYGWDLMQNSAALFEEDDYTNGKNITRRQVWNNYPNEPAPWTIWSHPKDKVDTLSLFRTLATPDNWEQTSLRLNDYKWFKLPVPEFGQGTVEADARHLIPKDGGNNGGNGTGNASVGTGGSKVIDIEEPMGGYEEEEPPLAAISVILLFMMAVAAFCFVRGSDEADADDEK